MCPRLQNIVIFMVSRRPGDPQKRCSKSQNTIGESIKNTVFLHPPEKLRFSLISGLKILWKITTVSRFSSGGATFPPSRASPDTEKRRPESQNTKGEGQKTRCSQNVHKRRGKNKKKKKNNKRRENEKRGKRKNENKKRKKKRRKRKKEKETNYIQNSRSPAPVAAVMLSSKKYEVRSRK